MVNEWQECRASCKNGGLGFRKRSVNCITRLYNDNDNFEMIKAMPQIECSNKIKPMVIEECKLNCNQTNETSLINSFWIVGEWTDVVFF
jgi:hypothetical protein